MITHTVYATFATEQRRAFVRITDDVQGAVEDSGVRDGMVLVSAMHITAGVWVNDDEPGILEDTLEWLDKLAPPAWKPSTNAAAQALAPDPGDDLGPWQAVFYAEFDGQRPKRLIIKVMGE